MRMRPLASVCVAALLLSVAGQMARAEAALGIKGREAEAMGAVQRKTTATPNVIHRSAASTSTSSANRDFGRRECGGCVATFEELQAALSGPLPVGNTVVTLCRSTKTTPIVLEESIEALVDGANLYVLGSVDHSDAIVSSIDNTNDNGDDDG